MGTRDASKIRKARKTYRCRQCPKPIEAESRYLDFKIGLMNSVRVHVDCALSTRYDSGAYVYACDALDAERSAQGKSSESGK